METSGDPASDIWEPALRIWQIRPNLKLTQRSGHHPSWLERPAQQKVEQGTSKSV